MTDKQADRLIIAGKVIAAQAIMREVVNDPTFRNGDLPLTLRQATEIRDSLGRLARYIEDEALALEE